MVSKMNIAIIDYGSGNIRSAFKALERARNDLNIIGSVQVVDKPKDVDQATHIILPGVGAFGDCIRALNNLEGMRDALDKAVIREGKPFLGICVGMQLLSKLGIEFGEHSGLGWLNSKVIPIEPTHPDMKIPHMGWNDITISKTHPIFEGISNGDHVYFVHSYHMSCKNKQDIIATVNYGFPVVAAVGKENIVGVQFHPEKSQAKGLKCLQNFIKWRP